jgi:hypothetical protein
VLAPASSAFSIDRILHDRKHGALTLAIIKGYALRKR